MKLGAVCLVVALASYAAATLLSATLTAMSLGIAPLTAGVFSGLGAMCAMLISRGAH